MSEFKEKLQGFIQHYNKLNALGEEAEDGFSSEFMVRMIRMAETTRLCCYISVVVETRITAV